MYISQTPKCVCVLWFAFEAGYYKTCQMCFFHIKKIIGIYLCSLDNPDILFDAFFPYLAFARSLVVIGGIHPTVRLDKGRRSRFLPKMAIWAKWRFWRKWGNFTSNCFLNAQKWSYWDIKILTERWTSELSNEKFLTATLQKFLPYWEKMLIFVLTKIQTPSSENFDDQIISYFAQYRHGRNFWSVAGRNFSFESSDVYLSVNMFMSQ